ncbi:hypothetical protein TNIN_10931 [Trichonephila inaurata madagascariensis]|uniref:Uncharacterized protein n=1 Tax=Trichonephila inaurata madagascariensis TaxID=2747483 RepID=A0A8X6XX16_9ARAC|nr:hypothetical protein TNIN_10931 [Trichonephila inaurata madagascariensis]
MFRSSNEEDLDSPRVYMSWIVMISMAVNLRLISISNANEDHREAAVPNEVKTVEVNFKVGGNGRIN